MCMLVVSVKCVFNVCGSGLGATNYREGAMQLFECMFYARIVRGDMNRN